MTTPKQFWALLARGSIELTGSFWNGPSSPRQEGDHEEAAQRWRTVIKRFPTFSLAYLKGAEALRTVGQDMEADALLELSVSRMKSDLPVHLAYARGAERRRDWPAAAERWALVRHRFPNARRLNLNRHREADRRAQRATSAS